MVEFRTTDVDYQWLVARLVEQIELVYRGCLVGGAAQTITSRFELMSRLPPNIGDLVLMGSVRPNTPPMDRLGWLEKVEDIPWPGDYEPGERVPTDRHWTIRTFDDRSVRWNNVQVLRAIRERRMGDYEVMHAELPEAKNGKGVAR